MPYGDLRDLLNERKQLTEAESSKIYNNFRIYNYVCLISSILFK